METKEITEESSCIDSNIDQNDINNEIYLKQTSQLLYSSFSLFKPKMKYFDPEEVQAKYKGINIFEIFFLKHYIVLYRIQREN